MARDRASRPEARPLRLFVAVDVPEAVRAELASAVAPFRGRLPGARWTDPSGWHVTLKFLGTTWPRLVDEVRGAVAAAAGSAAPFPASVQAIGAFPTPGRARVLWAGLSDPRGAFAPLVSALDDLLAAHFEPEKREFTPHLTLARLNPPQDLRKVAAELLDVRARGGEFVVDALVLYRSHLSPRGARYEALERFPLGAA